MKQIAKAVVDFHKNDGLIELCTIEEMAELTKAITKHQRGKGNIENTVEEVAHVMLMCYALMEYYNIDERLVLAEARRTVERMHASRPGSEKSSYHIYLNDIEIPLPQYRVSESELSLHVENMKKALNKKFGREGIR